MRKNLLLLFSFFYVGCALGQVAFLSETGEFKNNPPQSILQFIDRPAVSNAMVVDVNLKSLMEPEIKFEISGKSYSSAGKITEARSVGNFTWRGSSSDGEPFIFTVRGNEISGFFYENAVMNRLLTVNGHHVLYKVKQEVFPQEKCDVVPPQSDQLLKSGVRKAGASSLDCKVRVLFVYTQKAIDRMSGSLENFSQSCIDITNDAYERSGINTRLEVAHVYKSSFVENSSAMDQSLYNFTGTADGDMDEVHNLRSKYSADLCVLVGDYGDYCGIAWLYSDYDYSFSVNHVDCAIDNLTFPHELGHNFGAYHDPYVSSGNVKPYGYGYVNRTNRWRTIMAYNNNCAAFGFNCTRIPYFSNPDVNYGGVPTGTAGTHNNARLHNEEYAGIISISQPQNSLVLNPIDTVGVFGHAIARKFISNSNAFLVSAEERYKFNAGNSIELKPGFAAQNGSVFEAEIKSVNDCGLADQSIFQSLNEKQPLLDLHDGNFKLSNSATIQNTEWLDALGNVALNTNAARFLRVTSQNQRYLYKPGK